MILPTAIVLDPHEVADSRKELNLNATMIRIAEAGPDWGDAQIAAQLAELERGEAPAGYRIGNRQVKLPLILGAQAPTGLPTENEVPNPGFEYDTVGQPPALWRTSGTGSQLQAGAALTVVNTHVKDGTQACQIVTTNALTNEGASISLGWLPAGTYTVAGWLVGNAGSEPVEVLAGNVAAAVTIFNSTLTTSYQRVTGTFTTDGTVECCVATRTHTASVRTWFMDSWTVSPGTTVPAAFLNGDTSGYYWLGTPGQSTTLALDSSYEGARAALQAKVARIQAEGGWLKRGSLYADVMNATLLYPDKYAHLEVEGDVVLTLECLPDFYDDEITLPDHVETTNPELLFVERGGIRGDYPGRLRLVIDNDQATDQRGLIAAVRSRHYDPAATAALVYEAEALTPLDVAATTALSGASGSGSNTIRHNNLSLASWTAVMNTNLLAGTFLTHKGSYRVCARVYTTLSPPPSLRFAWAGGDLLSPEVNAQVALPGANAFYLIDLGEIRLDPAPVGTHRWQGQIQAYGGYANANIYIDRLWLVPLDEGAVKLTAPNTSLTDGLTATSARDSFQNSGANVTGQTLDVGGTWVAGAGSDPTDFSIGLGKTANRSEVSDAANAGRYVIAGTTTLAAVAAKVDVGTDSLAGIGMKGGVLTRYIDQSNWLLAHLRYVSASTLQLKLTKRTTGGGVVDLAVSSGTFPAGPWYTITVLVDAVGNYRVWCDPILAAASDPVLVGQHADLATGGTLASGKFGFYDENTTATVVTRAYDNFLAYAPALDAVVFASQSVQVGSDGNYRKDPTGTAWGPVSIQSGDLLRIPPSGVEGRVTEVLVKLSRGDLDEMPDSGIDDLSAQAFYRPSFLFPYQGE